MRLESVELIRVAMPLVRPFRTSFGTQTERDALLVHVTTDVGEGWGECVAGHDPSYSSEYVSGAIDVMRHFLIPTLFRLGNELEPENARFALAGVRGHRMSKAALEMALIDARLRGLGQSFAGYLGAKATRVESGVSVGIPADNQISTLMDDVDGYLSAGYQRIKLKIEPEWDIEPVAAVRAEYPEIRLQVDANQAYGPADIDTLLALDDYNLLLIEQPFAEEDLLTHAEFAREAETPVCLDESILDMPTLYQALELKAVDIVNIKPGRVGGYLEAVDIHNHCRAVGIPVWCGGMLETGIGRAANVALAALPGFTLPGDVSASDRFYERDIITEPFVLVDGGLEVPQGPGLGVEPDLDAINDLATWREALRP